MRRHNDKNSLRHWSIYTRGTKNTIATKICAVMGSTSMPEALWGPTSLFLLIIASLESHYMASLAGRCITIQTLLDIQRLVPAGSLCLFLGMFEDYITNFVRNLSTILMVWYLFSVVYKWNTNDILEYSTHCDNEKKNLHLPPF